VKIGLSGAGGTGKGTIARQIQEIYPEFEMIESPVEHIGKLIMPQSQSFRDIDNRTRRDFQYSCVTAQIQNEWFLKNRGISYISERSLFDYLAYYLRDSGEIMGYRVYEKYVLRAHESNPYDIIFYCCNDFKPHGSSSSEGDSWKERDEQSRKRRDDFLRRKFFEEKIFNGRIIELSGTPEERLKTVSAVLSEII